MNPPTLHKNAIFLSSLLLILLFHPALHAKIKKGPLTFGSLFQYEHFSFLQSLKGLEYMDRTANIADSRHEFLTRPTVQWEPLPSLQLLATPEFRGDLTYKERSKIFLYEGHLDIFSPRMDVLLGKQFITWGRADIFKPTDVFKRHDSTDFVEDRQAAIVALKGDISLGPWLLELVWAPFFEKDALRLESKNRWSGLPSSGLINNEGPFGLNYRVADENDPPLDPRSSQAGVRLGRSFEAWDFAFMYAASYDRTPTSILQQVTQTNPATGTASIDLVTSYKHRHVVGGDFATHWRDWGIRGEVAYTLTEDIRGRDPTIDDPYVQWVLGIDYTWVAFFKEWDLWMIVQYALDTELPSRGGTNQNGAGNPLKHFFQNALFSHLKLDFDFFTHLEIKGYINLENGDRLLQPEFQWNPFDGLTLIGGADFMGGPANALFGLYQNNDRIRFSVKYEF